MKLVSLALVGGLTFLAACGEESCTEAQAQQKMMDLTTKIQALGATAPEKVAAAAPKMQEIGTQLAGGSDINAVCKALDEMLVELDK